MTWLNALRAGVQIEGSEAALRPLLAGGARAELGRPDDDTVDAYVDELLAELRELEFLVWEDDRFRMDAELREGMIHVNGEPWGPIWGLLQ